MKSTGLSKKVSGFTLIEVMIVVAIVAILASVALPAYTEQVRKSRRTDAQRHLITWAQALERSFTANGTYLVGGACNTGKPPDDATNSSRPYYDFSTTVCTATTFTLKADPKGAQEGDGDQTIAHTGARTGKWKI